VESLLQALQKQPDFTKYITDCTTARGGITLLSGLSAVHKAHVAAAVHRIAGRPILLICENELRAQSLQADIEHFLGIKTAWLPERDFVFHNVEGVSRQWERLRISALEALLQEKNVFAITTIKAAAQRTLPKEILKKNTLSFKINNDYDIEALVNTLINAGYARTELVEAEGQFARRGFILDIFPSGHRYPVRLEFFGDTLDAMGTFNIETQRRIENVQACRVLPAKETLFEKTALLQKMEALHKKQAKTPLLQKTIAEDIERLKGTGSLPSIDRYLPLVYDEFATPIDYLPADTLVFLDQIDRLQDSAKAQEKIRREDEKNLLEHHILSAKQIAHSLRFEELQGALSAFSQTLLATFTTGLRGISPDRIVSLTAGSLTFPQGNLDPLITDLQFYLENGYETVLLAQNKTRGELLKKTLDELGVPSVFTETLGKLTKNAVHITVGSLSAGFVYQECKLAVYTEQGNSTQGKKSKAKTEKKNRLRSFTDLNNGDLIVHDIHGIGRFMGLVKMQVDGVFKDYLKISYQGNDVLYVPVTQLDMIAKYIGAGEDTKVRLSKFGGADWSRVKTKAKSAARDIAKQLIALYAERAKRKGFAASPDSEWQREFELSFMYDETDDQLSATREIKEDMEKACPMDRLLCGDVGFGKTEVALRAIMKAILSGKQAALLAPTTVLARQHYLTALARFEGFPVRIGHLSRYTSAKDTARLQKEAREGRIDLLIGTHKLLKKDLVFKELGLLVVDEEQRFGVAHKEKLKEKFPAVDVLTLTATPIPRTLNMALSGIRDMSSLEEAPRDRRPVQTYVLEYDRAVLREAIVKEIARGGQVFYLHNRVDSIDKTASGIASILQGITVATIHGKMSETEIGETMTAMADGAIHVLVCTTIIETGIDLPNVNTLIIEDADRLGLAQLHQIRGRVGRSSRHASAYLTYKKDKVLTEVAAKRLSAIREFAEFGAGYKIAMRDLEIRGAGDVLGAEQSGHMMSVGYEMYLRILAEVVAEEEGSPTLQAKKTSVDLPVSAYIPEQYISTGQQRVDMYRAIASIADGGSEGEVVDELLDRFGDIPKEVQNLITIARIRASAALLGITDIDWKDDRLRLFFDLLPIEKILDLERHQAYRRRIFINGGKKPHAAVSLQKSGRLLDFLEKLLEDLAKQG